MVSQKNQRNYQRLWWFLNDLCSSSFKGHVLEVLDQAKIFGANLTGWFLELPNPNAKEIKYEHLPS